MIPTLMRFGREFLARLVPAVLTALGVVIVTAGLISYGSAAGPGATASPSAVAGSSAPVPSPSLVIPPATPDSPSPESPAPSTSGPTAVVTRVVVPALRIDLPVVAAPTGYPYCDVAMYLTDPRLGQPGQDRATYLFAHARDGMFGPIYNLVIVQRTPSKMVGMIVQVYTDDNRLHLYEITAVYPHQLDLDRPLSATSEELWLQTSEGPRGTPGKTQVLALPLSVGDADPADAHPTPHPVVCG